MKKFIKTVLFAFGISLQVVSAQTPMEKFEFVNFSRVNITDRFWKPKMDLVATATLSACIYQTETVTPRLRNFEKVARKKGEKHEGIYYDDSDVYKALEAMSYSISRRMDRQNRGCPVGRWLPEYLLYFERAGQAMDGC
jgi:hypothetical protein